MIKSIEEITEIVKIIDTKYLAAKKQKLSRYSVEWGLWSRKMNIQIRESIESKEGEVSDQIKTSLKYLFNYWITTSRLLESCFRFRLSRLGEKRRITDEIKELRESILNEQYFDGDDPPEMMGLIQSIKEK